MSFLKKIVGSFTPKEHAKANEPEDRLDAYKSIPWMTNSRLENVTICLDNGFVPTTSLPTDLGRQLRPAIEIAQRLNAIKALILWLMIPEEELANEKILNFVKNNELDKYIAEDELEILNASRDDEELRNIIGWKFENAWPLAWYFGYNAPDMTGEMMTGEQMQEILLNYTCPLDDKLEEWLKNRTFLSEEELLKKEDLFYCLHNAVRSAQLGGKTVPNNFDPIGNAGVIHERRHALTWMLSKGTTWDNTDLST
jgi:Domain of unknown function (DUF4272)